MAYKILTDDCVSCGACDEVCPHHAIIPGRDYTINPDLCDECANNLINGVTLCVDACPVIAIVKM